MQNKNFTEKLQGILFSHRTLVLFLLAALTIMMAFFASQLQIDASFKKNIPLEHPYMQTYLQYQNEFGGANRILVAVENKNGEIFEEKFFSVLESVTKEVKATRGIDPSKVSSLFTPNTRFVEVDEFGFNGGPVIDAEFQPTTEGFQKVQQNVLKAGIVGRLVANNFKSAMVSAQLLDADPEGGPVNYIALAHDLEDKLRKVYQDDDISIHIIGFAKMIGDVSDGAKGVVQFFGIAIVISLLLVFIYSKSFKLTILPIATSIIAVIWQLGLLTILGFGIDPMSILVPFLVFAIGVSHGVQMINAMSKEVIKGVTPFEAAGNSFRRLLLPGGIALLSDTLGFLTLLLIQIDVIQELAVAASIGVAVIVITNLMLLPLLLSYVKLDTHFVDKVQKAQKWQDGLWQRLSKFGTLSRGINTVLLVAVLAVVGSYYAANLRIGDQHAGAPALRPESIYNMDTQFITDNYSIGVDLITVIVEGKKDSCIDYEIMNAVDNFHWQMSNVPGVQSVISLPGVAKKINAAYNEGYLGWRVLQRNSQVLSQSTGGVPTDSGLLNSACSVVPVLIFTEDHRAETIEVVVQAVKDFSDNNPTEGVKYRLASAPVGVLAATNEEVSAAQMPMLYWVYGVVIILCLLTFRSIRGTMCVIIPLAVVSILAQASMTLLQIGLTVATLPVIALGVGVGVDYGIYIFSRMVAYLREGMPVQEAFLNTLRETGNAVIITGLTLGIAVSTWIFSDLQFQADMGLLLTFMFLVNMLGAIILLPALAALLYRKNQ